VVRLGVCDASRASPAVLGVYGVRRGEES